MKQQITNERAAVMVEAVIVFPIVLFTVFTLIYLGLFKLQEMAMLYQVQRVAHQGSLVAASPGYKELGDYTAKGIDFESPPAADVLSEYQYYKAAHKNILVLYREVFGCTWVSESDLQSFLDKLANSTRMLAAGSLADNRVDLKIHRGFLDTKVKAEITYQFPTPGVLRFFGFPNQLQYKQSAVSTAVNPPGFVRNTDLVGDAVVVISKKLGFDGELGKISEGLGKVRDFLF